MPTKQRSAKRQERNSFLTPDFLRKQKMLLEAKLVDCLELQKSAQSGIKVCPPDGRRGDLAEQALTFSEMQYAAKRLDCCGTIIPLIRRALGLIDNSLAGKRSVEHYGICVDCDRLMLKQRLVAVPWAPRCVPCQEEVEMPLLGEFLLEDSLAQDGDG